MMQRMTEAVADLWPDDIILKTGYVVRRHPYGNKGLGGTMLPCDRSTNSEPFVVTDYYKDSETPVDILREV